VNVEFGIEIKHNMNVVRVSEIRNMATVRPFELASGKFDEVATCTQSWITD
jgi:hypothetical protein